MAEDVSTPVSSNDANEAEIAGLQKIEDGSITSNIHTQKWRVFTDSGRDLFLEGKLEDAEKLFLAAIQEAKEGFGDRDSHVASACNNLAELYRVKKELDKAKPLYLEAISILEESFGHDDIRVGAALHNLGQFYLVQQNLEQARVCYERALKIKRRVLGEAHPDYADTMYHLGTVLHFQGKEKDSETLIWDSIRILEDVGQGESIICTKRMRHLAEMYLKSNRIAEAVNLQRKILHKMELSKGWGSLDTVLAAERLALTLLTQGSLTDAQQLLERCLDARKILLPENHIEVAGNMLHIARLKMLSSNKLRKTDASQAITELDMAKDLLSQSIRVAQKVLAQTVKERGQPKSFGVSRQTGRYRQLALIILLKSLNTLALLEVTKVELQESKVDGLVGEAENALHQCISAFREFETEKPLADIPEVKAEYLSCLKYLFGLINIGGKILTADQSDLQQLKAEINRMEVELSAKGRPRS
ncbi:kinesin light chain 3 isoform X2 [Ipomoea triloba]|nr:kinesin light chain 3 isoform X2 [Ipomoea triloba]